MSKADDPLFSALAHPVRRGIVERLLLHEELAVGELAADELSGATLSASALSQHLKVLRDAGLVATRREGRSILYRLTPEPLLEIVAFAERIRAGWERRLDTLGAYLDASSSSSSPSSSSKKSRTPAGGAPASESTRKKKATR